MERCPVCRARFKGEPACRRCRRCKSDLTHLVAVEQQAEYMILRAMQHLTSGNIEQARRFSVHSEHAHRTGFAAVLIEFLDTLAVEKKKLHPEDLRNRPQ